MKDNIYIINGPNLNKLGTREHYKYGRQNIQEIEDMCKNKCDQLNLSYVFFQSNIEGEIVNKIHDAIDENIKAIIINAAAYSHTSVAILDALNSFTGYVIEVHISDISKREEFRKFSYVSLRADHVIMGKGLEGYIEAIEKMQREY